MLQYGEMLSSDIPWITYGCRGDVTVWWDVIIRYSLNNLWVPWWCYSMAGSYRRTFIETAGDVKDIFFNKVFCGWDFGIATSDAADLKSNSIYNELQVSVRFVTSLLTHLLPPSATHWCVCCWYPYSCLFIVSPYLVLKKTSHVVSVVRCLTFLSNSRHEGFGGLVAAGVETAVFWNMTLYGLVLGCRLYSQVGGCWFLWSGCISLLNSMVYHFTSLFLLFIS